MFVIDPNKKKGKEESQKNGQKGMQLYYILLIHAAAAAAQDSFDFFSRRPGTLPPVLFVFHVTRNVRVRSRHKSRVPNRFGAREKTYHQ